MSRFSFRARLFIALLIASVLPLAMVAGAGAWAVANRPALNATNVIEPVALTERSLLRELGKLPDMSPELRLALQSHNNAVDTLSIATTQTSTRQRSWAVKATEALLIAAGVLIVVIAIVSLRLARQYSAPLNDIVDWTRRIQRHEALPPRNTQEGTVPELVTLQQSLYELQQGLEQARAAELEAERLRAFGEVARRVAHEMKNPLTPIRLAVRQLSRRAPPEMQVELEVIATESARLEAMAKDFAELGRLPAGIAAPVDLCELLDDLLRNAVPEGMTREFHAPEPGLTIDGYYDPLRRAFSNVLRNAVEACKGKGAISVAVRRERGRIQITVRDTGPGVPPDNRERIFEPYFTDKGDGTGLGLAIVRQTIEQHHGTISVDDAPGGGATFLVQFPA